MRIVSIILSIILIFTMCSCFVNCKLYEVMNCNIYEIVDYGDYIEVTIEKKDGNLYAVTVNEFDKTKEKCFVVFYNNNTENAEDDEIIFLL